jgi:hypothetical protein
MAFGVAGTYLVSLGSMVDFGGYAYSPLSQHAYAPHAGLPVWLRLFVLRALIVLRALVSVRVLCHALLMALARVWRPDPLESAVARSCRDKGRSPARTVKGNH